MVGTYMGIRIIDHTGRMSREQLDAMAKARYESLNPPKVQPRPERVWRERDAVLDSFEDWE